MFGLSDAHHFRKMVAGFCMVFAPLFVLVGLVLNPDASYVFMFAGTAVQSPFLFCTTTRSPLAFTP